MSASESSPLNDLLFIQQALTLQKRDANWTSFSTCPDNTYVLIAVTEGMGSLQLKGQHRRLQSGDCYLFLPNTVVGITNDSNAQLNYYELIFTPLVAAIQGQNSVALLPYEGKLTVSPFFQLLDYLHKISEPQTSRSGLNALRAHLDFQELLYFLFKQNDNVQPVPNSLLAVQETIDQLLQNYGDDITVEQLAQKANIGIWQYRQLFKQLTGLNPTEYITQLRINRAKEILLVSDAPLSDIAHSVGYKDEYYFNRRFREIVGTSPRQYIRSRKSKLKTVAFTHLGDILSLGTKPLAVEKHLLKWLDNGCTEGIQGIDTSSSGLDEIARLQPDLILVNDYTDPRFRDGLEQIAPTVQLNTRRVDIFAGLKDVSELLGRQPEARAWLTRYRLKARQLKERTRTSIRRGESAVFFHVVHDNIYLYRPEECPVLYDVLGLEVPFPLQQLIAVSPSRMFIPADRFAHYEADRIFIVCGHMPGARETFQQIVHSEAWKALEAVRSGHAYYVNEHWTLDSTIALEWQLDGMHALLNSKKAVNPLYW
ncbi:helix-turn-helix domain-containing protein [Paenibacillus sp. NPDC057934]|uniref:helix-turn-helix domain-containing protein n=1 Tax=Paenibacillus sp. NPDC057934 TaxID=3346282 RepID=UPI0036DF7C8D